MPRKETKNFEMYIIKIFQIVIRLTGAGDVKIKLKIKIYKKKLKVIKNKLNINRVLIESEYNCSYLKN